ncbi:MAG: sensor histidine kinase [Hyphomicrobiales bacterium]
MALNVAARLDHPYTYAGELDLRITRSGPGNAVNIQPNITLRDFEDQVYSENLDRLRLWSLISVVGLAIGSGIGGYVLSGMMLRPVRDITEVASEISATNLNRRIHHEGPNDELKALADTFDSMIDRLEHSFEQQRQFVQDASHELRTPLAAIRMNIEVAEMEGSLSENEYRELLETIKTQTERLTRLSEDLLLLSSNERGEEPMLEPLALIALAHDVSRQLQPLAASRGVDIVVQGDPSVEALANGDLLFRSVFNLVDNAIKYSGEGREVRIETGSEPGWVTVRVADNGPGIPLEQQALIFDRFYRVDRGRARRDGGIGLGLAIVKELVQSMGGNVSLQSTPGEGAAFTIRLRPAPAEERTAPEGIRESSARPPLLVED